MTDAMQSSAHRWERLAALFDQTMSMPEASRDAFLERETGREPHLRRELRELIAASPDAPEFLRRFSEDVVAPMLGAALAEPLEASVASDRPRATDASHADRSPVRVAHPPANVEQSPVPRVRHFEIGERLGAGGMGVVYRGRDTRLDRDVALKFVSPEQVAAPVARRRLLREAQAASSLSDAHVCAIHAVEELDDGGICVVMAYCEAGTLRDRLRHGPLTVAEALRIATQVAHGMASAHRRGIVHRDIKPANIGFDSAGAVRILDFGLALRRGDAMESNGVRLAGTLPYLAPEQLRDGTADERADIWALGVTLHEMLTGRRPFSGLTDASTLYAILENGPTPISRADGVVVPPALIALIDRMFSKDPLARPANGDALLEALSAIAAVQDHPGADAPAASPEPHAKRSMLRYAAIAGAIGAVSVAAFAVARLRDRDTVVRAVPPIEVARTGEPLPSLAVLPFTVRGRPRLEYLENGMVDLLTPAFDATGLVRGIDPNAVIGASVSAAPRTNVVSGLDSARARTFANTLGAQRYVVGTVVSVGAVLTVRATLHRANGEEAGRTQIVVDNVDGLPGGIERMVSELIAAELRAPGDTLAGLAAATTTSPVALRAYLDGERELRDARPAAAVVHFQRAVEADSLFALAWYRLARASGWNDVDSLNARATSRAFALANTLPLRLQELVRGYHAFRFGNPVEAERRFRQIVTDYPTDVDAWMLLGETLFCNNAFYGRPTDESTAAFRRVMALDPRHREVNVYLMDLAARAGRRGQLDTLFRMYFDPNSAGEQPGIRATYIALHARSEKSGGLRESARMRIDDPASALTALRRVGARTEDMAAARQFALRASSADAAASVRAQGLLALATLDAAAGSLEAMQQHLADAALIDSSATLGYRVMLALVPGAAEGATALRELRQQVQALRVSTIAPAAAMTNTERADLRQYMIGMLSVAMRDAASTELAIAALVHPAMPSRLSRPLTAALRGHLALQRGDARAAREALGSATLDIPVDLRWEIPLLQQQADRMAFADALRISGASVEAARWYASLRDGAALISAPYLVAAESRLRAISPD